MSFSHLMAPTFPSVSSALKDSYDDIGPTQIIQDDLAVKVSSLITLIPSTTLLRLCLVV